MSDPEANEELMSNVHLHPRNCRRFYSAVDNMVQGIREASLRANWVGSGKTNGTKQSLMRW